MTIATNLMNWLLDGDPSIAFQTKRDLLDEEDLALQLQIEKKGWGKALLDKRLANGHWGHSFYHPKWTSTHYTLLDLRNLEIRRNHPLIMESVRMLAENEKCADGGLNPASTIKNSDVCINGMFLNYASYFKIDESLLKSVVDFILSQKMPDGGFNCQLNRSGARHSSMHTTICTLEGIASYRTYGYRYRLEELIEAEKSSREFLLQHHLYKSDRTGEIIQANFTRLPYPYRWRYDYLRALDYFRISGGAWDQRMEDGLELLIKKRGKDGKWKVNAAYPGQVHFTMEKAGKASRWNTLRALRVLNYFVADMLVR